MSEFKIEPIIRVSRKGKILAEIPTFGWIPRDLEDCIKKARYLQYHVMNAQFGAKDILKAQEELTKLDLTWRKITGKKGFYSREFILRQLIGQKTETVLNGDASTS